MSFNATRHIRPFLEVAKKAGGDTERVLASLGLTERSLLDPATRVTFEVTQQLLQGLCALTSDPEVGLRAGACFCVEDLDLLGFVVAHCADAWSALQMVSRYSRLMCDSFELELRLDAGIASICVRVAGGRSMLPEAADCQAASVHHLLGALFDASDTCPSTACTAAPNAAGTLSDALRLPRALRRTGKRRRVSGSVSAPAAAPRQRAAADPPRTAS